MYRRTTMATLAAILTITGVAVAQQKKKTDHGPIPWITSLTTARKMAAKQKRIIMVDYFAEWCPPCKEMLATTYKDARVVAKAKRFIPALIDIDKAPKDAKLARVESIPTIVFYDHTGKELVRGVGYRDAGDFLKLMAEAETKVRK